MSEALVNTLKGGGGDRSDAATVLDQAARQIADCKRRGSRFSPRGIGRQRSTAGRGSSEPNSLAPSSHESGLRAGYSGSLVNGQVLPDNKRDYGEIWGFLNDGLNTIGVYGKMYVNYIGTSVQGAITGPDVPVSNSNATWAASAVGGTSPYSYAWYQNGGLVSSSSSYSTNVGTAGFGLRLVVTDQVNRPGFSGGSVN